MNYLKSIIAILAITYSFTSCVNDLDVTPIDPSTTMDFDQNKVFTKIYATMGLTGQQGPAGSGDVDGLDEGTSDFMRLIFNANQLPTDETHCNWKDNGILEYNHGSWDASHGQLTGLYYRLNFNITLCNFFLEKIENQTDDTSNEQRSEARFIRALNYSYLIDFFGNVPFSTQVSTQNPEQKTRQDVFGFIESELLDCANNLVDPQNNTWGRVDKAAAWLLLSRLYLNAEVYTGTAQWAKASEYAKKVMDSSYELSPVYQHLFMADNNGSDVNKANKEIILPILQDGKDSKNYGGSLFLIASTHKDDMNPSGTTAAWAGNRCRPDLLKKFFPTTTAPNVDEVEMVKAANDDRALFFGKDRKLNIEKESTFTNGFSCAKFSNLRADGAAASDPEFTDMDVPFMRKAEAYLTYAEALCRQNNGVSTGEGTAAINELHIRAHAPQETSYTLDDILEEWSKEFYFEGRRRMDLIRFGRFGGTANYNWQWKGGQEAGTNISAIYNVYPIPTKDLNANSNLQQNEGY